MNEIKDEKCNLYAKLPAYQRKLSRTQERVREMLEICATPYVAFSCGKDSTVVADMVLRIRQDVPLRFISSGETRILHNVDDVMDWFRQTHGATIEEINFDRLFSEEWQGASFDEQRKAGRRDIQTIDNTAYTGVFMGLRKQESRGRQISLNACKTDGLPSYMYQYKGRDYYRMCPLADWTTDDVGAYIVTHGIPTLRWYQDFGFDSRTTARLTGDAVRQNTLVWVKKNNPAGYARLLERFPEFGQYV